MAAAVGISRVYLNEDGACIGAEFSHHDTYKYELDFYISAHGGVFE